MNTKSFAKSVICLFLLLTTQSALASKARLRALGNSFHLNDYQSQFVSAYQIFGLADAISIESGNSNPTSDSDNATLTFNTTIDSRQKIAVGLGRLDETTQVSRRFMNAVGATTLETQQNAINFVYGIKGSPDLAFGTYYSNFKDKQNGSSESSGGLKLALSKGFWRSRLNLGLVNSVENATDGQFDGSPFYNFVLRHSGPVHRWGFDFTHWRARLNNPTGTEVQSHSFRNIRLQYVNQTTNEQGEFFMGSAVDSIEVQNNLNDKKLTRLALPVWMGLEKTVTDHLIFRGSITQTVLLAQSKDENGYPAGSVNGAFGIVDSDFAAEPNNTEAAMGVGLKLNKLLIDGTLRGLISRTQTQRLDSNSLLGQVAATYTY